MIPKKWIYLPVLIFLFFAFSCATPLGAPKFRPVANRDKAATLDDLKRNWTRYAVSYGGVRSGSHRP
jgi:hypothetical protein